MDGPVFCCCWKVLELQRGVDALSGEPIADPTSLGVSAADRAALEWALRCADAFGGAVRLLAAGSALADAVLRGGIAAGAGEALRVELDEDAPSEEVARVLATHAEGAAYVWCGDVSADRGSGAVPAFLAAHLGARQALGLVDVELGEESGAPRITALRRLEGGKRERLAVRPPAVCSCEGSVAHLRRAPLPSLIGERPLTVVDGPAPRRRLDRVISLQPFRPLPRAVEPPRGATAFERTAQLVGLGVGARPRTGRLPPDEAARAIISALEEWGER